MADTRKCMYLYHSWLPALEALSDAECGRLLRCALQYSATGQASDLPGNERFTWPLIRYQIDADSAKYLSKIEKLREAGLASANKCQHMSTNAVKEKEKEKEIEKEIENGKERRAKAAAFTPPTLEEISAYCAERGNAVDPQHFLDYYTSNGWKVGRNSMKDWKAAVRTWEQKDRPAGRKTSNIFAEIAMEEGIF